MRLLRYTDDVLDLRFSERLTVVSCPSSSELARVAEALDGAVCGRATGRLLIELDGRQIEVSDRTAAGLVAATGGSSLRIGPSMQAARPADDPIAALDRLGDLQLAIENAESTINSNEPPDPEIVRQVEHAVSVLHDHNARPADADALQLLGRLAEADRAVEDARRDAKATIWSALVDAREAFLDADGTRQREPWLPPTLAQQIEKAHANLVAAKAKATKKLAGPASFNRLLEAQDQLAALLEQLQLPDYDAYLAFRAGTYDWGGIQERRDRTRAAFKAAESAWADFDSGGGGGDPELTELLRRRVEIVDTAATLVGSTPDDPELRALLARFRPATESERAADATLARLSDAIGVDLESVDDAQAWIDSVDRRRADVADAQKELSKLRAEVEQTTRQLSGAPDPVATTSIPLSLTGALKSHRGLPVVGTLPAIIEDLHRSAAEGTAAKLWATIVEASRDIQVIYLTEDPLVVEWADSTPEATALSIPRAG